MTDPLKITRRDFVNGIALGAAAGYSVTPAAALAAMESSQPYPPGLTGLRGAHPGSFEIAHAVSWGDAQFPRPDELTDSIYDLVIVGGGLSGLAAAVRYRQQAGNSAKILVLDNHDDFGGHAKRNEFDVDGKKLICYGGSQSIDTPGSFSPAARQLLVDAGIELQRFYDYFDDGFNKQHELKSGVYFSASSYGKDALAPAIFGWRARSLDDAELEQAIGQYPLSDDDRAATFRMVTSERDYLAGDARETKIGRLRKMSYRDYLLQHVGVPESVYLLLRDSIKGLWGVGWDALSALEAYRMGMPGLSGLGIGELPATGHGLDEPYIFHFPDGNAGVARSLVRMLIPEAVPGSSMEDLVTARVDYQQLDSRLKKTRIRLNSTAVDVRHTEDQQHVDVTYIRNGQSQRVRARHAIWAGYNAMLPHVCAEVPAEQQEAISYASKVPLVYISIAVRNWRAFANLGLSSVMIPQPELMHSFGLDFPVSMGGYQFASKPDEPTVLHGTYVPTVPDEGLSAREQHTAGRRILFEKTYAEMEAAIIRQLQGALAPGGFDAARDIAGITINRWPHGYAYEYNDLNDPEGFSPENGPHVAGRAQIGRISIANSDASAFAYVNGAFDAAERAVKEQLKIR